MLMFVDSTPFGGRHLSDLFSTAAMRAIFNEQNSLQSLCDVEVALARAEAGLGIIPDAAAAAIAQAARADRLDLDELAKGTERAGLPIVNLVEQLVRLTGTELGEFVHWGATSQDIMDTALVLQIRQALTIVAHDLDRLIAVVAGLAHDHRDTAMVGRTKLMHALPITFGFKAAVWLSGLLRQRQRLVELTPRILQVQFGGAVGTFASLGGDGPRVRTALARALDLGEPVIGWHAVRDSLAETVGFLALLSTTLSKIATDLSLMAQTEVAEILEPGGDGHGASSTMPHKRNPIICEQILSSGLALRRLSGTMLDASIHDHERATGPWQAEWLVVPQAFLLISGALRGAIRLCSGVVVRPDIMQANLQRTQGLVTAEAMMMALAGHVGRHHAHVLVSAACAATSGRPLAETLAAMPEVAAHFTRTQIEAVLDPACYTGAAGEEVDRVLAAMAGALDTSPQHRSSARECAT